MLFSRRRLAVRNSPRLRYFAAVTTLALACLQLLELTAQQARALLNEAGSNPPRELSRVEKQLVADAQANERVKQPTDPRSNHSTVAIFTAPTVPVTVLAAKLDSAESLPGSRANMKLLRALMKKSAQQKLVKKASKDMTRFAAQRMPSPPKAALNVDGVESARDVTYRNLAVVIALEN